MTLKDLDILFSEISTPDASPISETAFRNLFLERARAGGPLQRALGLAANALQGFRLADRPVLSRVLAVHQRIHYALLRLDSAGGISRMTWTNCSLCHLNRACMVSLKYLMQKRRARPQPLLSESPTALR